MRHKLLLADDSVTTRRVVELMFADEGIEVVAVGGGPQAIGRIKADLPDIVLADIGMPAPDGYDVAAFVKGDPALAGIPVLLLSSTPEQVDHERAARVGSDGVMAKPFDPHILIPRVKELLARAPGPTASQTPADAKKPADPLDAYFERLDAAFSTIPVPGSRPAPVGDDSGQTARELRGEREGTGPAEVRESRPGVPSLASHGGPPDLAQAFAALLAAEEGRAPILAPGEPRSVPARVDEATIEEIVQRVIARMGDDSMRQLVADTAERLVREEIERIKKIRDSLPSKPGA
jgi:CheY-like chemotaxis protein